MRVLLVGSGGREHALAWKLSQSPACEKLFCAPGNAGISQSAECIAIGVDDNDALVSFAIENSIDLVVVGPEAPLVNGLTDALQQKNISVFGPSQEAAQLEGSKGFMKDLCAKYNIPTAGYERFTDLTAAETYIKQHPVPLVVKADGLAAGKGVIIAETTEQALEAATDMLSGNKFGEAGHSIVVEEFLNGEEISYFALCDGETVLPFGSAQDHKRAYDGDKGPNTGGMGTYTPAPVMNEALDKKIQKLVIEPLVEGMKQEGHPFTGVIFAGFMVENNEPKLVEINVRFGDPECQVLMMTLDSDLLTILAAAAQGTLKDVKADVKWKSEAAMCVVMAAEGYPGSYKKATLIQNIEDADNLSNVKVFHAGTAFDDSGNIVSAGGRVLGITALGKDVQDAQNRVYSAVERINWPEGFYRRDIGWRAIQRRSSSDDSSNISAAC